MLDPLTPLTLRIHSHATSFLLFYPTRPLLPSISVAIHPKLWFTLKVVREVLLVLPLLQYLPRMPHIHQDQCDEHRNRIEDINKELMVLDVVVD